MNETDMQLVWPPAAQPPLPRPDRTEGHPGPRQTEDQPVPLPARFEIYRYAHQWWLHDRERNRAIKCRSHQEAVDRMNVRLAAERFGSWDV